ncbi:MAG: tetratricopeptide repeat protein [Chitinophagaceae bacterium]|nr:tetratricopeptide repeat protein [Chitinophagaceae bacterium]
MKPLAFLMMCSLVAKGLFAQTTDSAVFYYDKGMEEKAAKRYREAEKAFQKSYGFNTEKVETHIEWGNVLLEQRRYQEAYYKFKKADSLQSNNNVVLEQIAQLSFNLRKYEDAIKVAKQLQAAKYGSGWNWLIARSQYELQFYAEAIKYCEAAFKETANNPEIVYIAGRSFMEMHNYKRAAGCFDQALAMDSSNATWMYEAGLAWYAVPDDKKALYWIEKAGQNGYKKTNDYLENLATAYLNTGNLGKGVEMLIQVLERRPSDPELLYSIAEAYYKGKKYDSAIEYWDRILEVDKKNANALYMIGMCYQKKGDTAKGNQLCDKAIEMDPSLRKLKEEKKLPNGL